VWLRRPFATTSVLETLILFLLILRIKFPSEFQDGLIPIGLTGQSMSGFTRFNIWWQRCSLKYIAAVYTFLFITNWMWISIFWNKSYTMNGNFTWRICVDINLKETNFSCKSNGWVSKKKLGYANFWRPTVLTKKSGQTWWKKFYFTCRFCLWPLARERSRLCLRLSPVSGQARNNCRLK
jgi:hypothetical protein